MLLSTLNVFTVYSTKLKTRLLIITDGFHWTRFDSCRKACPANTIDVISLYESVH